MNPDLLQWLNILLVPMAAAVVRQGERIARLEAHIGTLLERRAEARA